MLDVAYLVAFIAIPIVVVALTRSLTWLAIGFTFVISILGTALQASDRFKLAWNFREVQAWLLAGLIVLAIVAWRTRGPKVSLLRRQVVVVLIPILTLAATVVVMRLLAPGSPGPLTGVGWLMAHTYAEDNAKWLNLASQLASGSDLNFNGFAGGPLVMIMTIAGTAAAALSQIFFGGFNQVAVAVNTIIGSELLLVVLVPLAFTPFAESLIPRNPVAGGAVQQRVPAVAVWAGMLVMTVGSAVLTTLGHLSLQYVVVSLGLWCSVFLAGSAMKRAYLLASLVMIATASVWFPLNGLALLVLASCYVVVGRHMILARRRGTRIDWFAPAAVLTMTITMWDALISSTLYAIGGSPTAAGAIGGGAGGIATLARVPAGAFPLFEAGGGTETVGAALGVLTAAALLGAAILYSRDRVGTPLQRFLPFAPLTALVAYELLLVTADGLVTGAAPHYGAQKMGFAVAIIVCSISIPVALMAIDSRLPGLTLGRGLAVLVILFVLVADTLLPRGISALSFSLWAAPDAEKPPFWIAAEVKPTADQPISSLPIACVFLPNGAAVPSGQPDGQLAYNCTRFLIGLSGVEGHVGGLMDWISADWLANGQFWNDWYGSIAGAADEIKARKIVLLDADAKVIGYDTLSGLLRRYPQPTTTSG